MLEELKNFPIKISGKSFGIYEGFEVGRAEEPELESYNGDPFERIIGDEKVLQNLKNEILDF